MALKNWYASIILRVPIALGLGLVLRFSLYFYTPTKRSFRRYTVFSMSVIPKFRHSANIKAFALYPW